MNRFSRVIARLSMQILSQCFLRRPSKMITHCSGMRHSSSTMKLPSRYSDISLEPSFPISVLESIKIAERVPPIGLRVVSSNVEIIRAKYSCNVSGGVEHAKVSLRGCRLMADRVVRATAGMTGNRVQTSRWQSIRLLLRVSATVACDPPRFERKENSVAFCLTCMAVETMTLLPLVNDKIWIRPLPSSLVIARRVSDRGRSVEWMPV
jgi:hypothetical protein